MSGADRYNVDPMWFLTLRDAGINPVEVARRAGLPEDIFTRRHAKLTAEEYFQLWRGLDATVQDPAYPLMLARQTTPEGFDAPLFASLCSPDLNTALSRLSLFKRLICPMRIEVASGTETTVRMLPLQQTDDIPASLLASEIVFIVHLARMATREAINPIHVTTAFDLQAPALYAEYFGVSPVRDEYTSLTFSGADARRPFLTENEAMWRFFQPELQKRLSKLDDQASFTDKVRGSLLELLPSGQASMAALAKKLGVSTRTLQRRLRDEATTFQAEVATTREQLAKHYLHKSELSSKQIAYLLGYEDPNSFIRAFHTATGITPERYRTHT